MSISPVTPQLRAHLDLALEAGGLGAWEWRVDSGQVLWDATLERIYGLEPGSFDGTVETYRSMIHLLDRDDAAEIVAAAQAEGVGYETEHRIVRADGTVRWTHGWARPLFDDAGGVVGYVGVVADITEQRETMDRLADALATAELAAQRYADVAETLQRSLLPPVPPKIPGVEVATTYAPALDGLTVGGDFYDITQLGRRTWVLALGDVCGKGAPAAALTGLARYSARGAVMQGFAPAAALRHVNDVLFGDQADVDEPRFATMVLARLRRRAEGLDVTFACAGHPAPYVLRADGEVETPAAPGMLLGLFPSIAVTNVPLVLGPGDAFVVMTDGVLEAQDRRGRQLADDMPALLREVCDAPAGAIVAAVERAALDRQGGTARDDVAIVAVRVPPTAS